MKKNNKEYLREYYKRVLKARRQAKRAEIGKPLYKHTCIVCGKEFESEIKIQKLCSDECRNKRATELRKEYVKTVGREKLREAERRSIEKKKARLGITEYRRRQNERMKAYYKERKIRNTKGTSRQESNKKELR